MLKNVLKKNCQTKILRKKDKHNAMNASKLIREQLIKTAEKHFLQHFFNNLTLQNFTNLELN